MKDDILDYAEEIVQDKGLSAVSFQQLADAVGLSKTSVFHHFPNRDALALALIERCRTKYGAEYGAISTRKTSAPQKLKKIATSFEKGLKSKRLCLLASLGSSQSTLAKPLQLELKKYANGAVETFSKIFAQGREEGSLKFEGTSEDAARAFLALLQGMQQLARYCDDPDIFRTSINAYLSTLEKD